MDDKGYVSSMLAVNSVLFQVNGAFSEGKKDITKGGKLNFCKKIAGAGAMDFALLGMLKALYNLMIANGMKPDKYTDELKKLVPGEAFNKMEIGNAMVRYGINRAKRLNGVMRFMSRYKLMNTKAISRIEDVEIRNAVESIPATQKALSSMSKFETDYVKLKEGYDKPDSPFLLIKRYTEILQKNDKAAREGKKIELGDNEYVQQIKIGKKTYRVIKHTDFTVSVVDKNGNSKNVTDDKAAEELIRSITKSDGLTKDEDKKEVKKPVEEKKEKPVEEKIPVPEKKEEKQDEELFENKAENTEIKSEENKTEEVFEKTAIAGDQIFKEEAATHFTPEYVRKKLENVRLIFMTKGVKNSSDLKKAMKKPAFKKNSAEWNKFFENDGGTEYKQMAKAMNECIDLLAAPQDEKWSENILDVLKRLKESANSYRITHKSILRFIGTNQHVTKVGDVRVTAAMQLMYEASVYEKMLSSYIANGGKDLKAVKDNDKETARLNNVMDARNEYIGQLFKDKLGLSIVDRQYLIAWSGDDSFIKNKAGKLEGVPKDPGKRALWCVAVRRMRKLMDGDITPEQIMSMAEKDFVKGGLWAEANELLNNPANAPFFKASGTGKHELDNEIHQQIMNTTDTAMTNKSQMEVGMNQNLAANKMQYIN